MENYARQKARLDSPALLNAHTVRLSPAHASKGGHYRSRKQPAHGSSTGLNRLLLRPAFDEVYYVIQHQGTDGLEYPKQNPPPGLRELSFLSSPVQVYGDSDAQYEDPKSEESTKCLHIHPPLDTFCLYHPNTLSGVLPSCSPNVPLADPDSPSITRGIRRSVNDKHPPAQ